MGRNNFLAMNGKRINTLDELRANFNPELILSFYRSGRLQKWLEECGATEELENINGLEDGYDEATLLSMIMAVFELSDEQCAKALAQQKAAMVAKEAEKEAVPSQEDEKQEDTADEALIEKHRDIAITDGPRIHWRLCGFPAKLCQEEITAINTAFEDLSPSSRTFKAGEIPFIQMFFAKGCFWCFLAKGKEILLLQSSDGLHWNNIKSKMVVQKDNDSVVGSVVAQIAARSPMVQNSSLSARLKVFQNNDFKVVCLLDDGLFISSDEVLRNVRTASKYIQYRDDNWEKIDGTSSAEDIEVIGNKIFIRGGLSNSESLSVIGDEWVKNNIPRIATEQDFMISKSDSFYFLPGGYLDDFLFYSIDGIEWKLYTQTKDKVWQKIIKNVGTNNMIVGNNRIIFYSPDEHTYILGDIEK